MTRISKEANIRRRTSRLNVDATVGNAINAPKRRQRAVLAKQSTAAVRAERAELCKQFPVKSSVRANGMVGKVFEHTKEFCVGVRFPTGKEMSFAPEVCEKV